MSHHVVLQVRRFHDFVALFALSSSLHAHPVLDLLVVDNAAPREELQVADVAVVGEVLQRQLGEVHIQGFFVLLRRMHLRNNHR